MAETYSVNLYPKPTDEVTSTQPVFSVCFSGGGSRAMSSALGQISALNTMADPSNSSGKLMDRILYISSVSGGTWGSVPFVYLPEQINGQDVDDEDLLITPHAPGDLYKGRKLDSSSANMAYMSKYCMGTAPGGFTVLGILAFMRQWIADAEEYDLPLSWLWTDIVANFILKPFGLSSVHYEQGTLAPAKTFSLSEAYAVKEILPDNPDLSPTDFYYARSGRPHHIANFNLLQDIRKAPQMPVQATPVSTGAPGQLPDGSVIGGGACESFGFASTLTGEDAENASVQMKRYYSLCDTTACSSAFFAQYIQALLSGLLDKMAKDFDTVSDPQRLALKYALRRSRLPKIKAKIASLRKDLEANGYAAIVPQYTYWPLNAVGTGNPGETYGFSDGGSFDNTGLLGLLARTTGNIKAIAFINCEMALSFSDNHTLIADDQLSRLFGFKGFDKKSGTYPSYGGMNPDVPMSYAQIFAGGETAFQDLLNQLAANASDSSGTLGKDIAWAKQKLTTVDNPVAAITAGRTVDVLWVYNSPIARWQDQITDPDILQDLAEGQSEDPSGPLAHFPNYSTFTQFCLKPYPVNVLAQLAAWTVEELSGEIEKTLLSES